MSFSLFRSENKPEVEQDSTPTALSEADGSVELVSPPKKQLPLLSLARELAFSNIQVVTSNPKQSVMIPYRSMPFDDFRRHIATLPERQQLTMAHAGADCGRDTFVVLSCSVHDAWCRQDSNHRASVVEHPYLHEPLSNVSCA